MLHPDDLNSYYRGLTDDELLQAYIQGPRAYEPIAWQIVSREVERRRLPVPEIPKPDFDPVAVLEDIIPEGLTEDQIEAALAAAHRQSGVAFWWLMGGIAVTLGTWAAAVENGGTYVVAWGAVVYGFLRLWQAESRVKELTRARRRISR